LEVCVNLLHDDHEDPTTEVYRVKHPVLKVTRYGGNYVNVHIPGKIAPTTIEKRVFELFFAAHAPPKEADSHGSPKE
jgi:hypothetical protein